MNSHRRLALLATLAALALAPAAFAAPTTFAIDPAHSDFAFKVRHYLTQVPGHFNEFSGTIVRDDENLANASVQITIKTASIDTGLPVVPRTNSVDPPPTSTIVACA